MKTMMDVEREHRSRPGMNLLDADFKIFGLTKDDILKRIRFYDEYYDGEYEEPDLKEKVV